MDDVTLDPAGSVVESSDVNPAQVDAPGVDAVSEEPRDVAQGHRIPERVEDGARADEVPCRPRRGHSQTSAERVVAAPEAVPHALPHQEADGPVVVPEVSRAIARVKKPSCSHRHRSGSITPLFHGVAWPRRARWTHLWRGWSGQAVGTCVARFHHVQVVSRQFSRSSSPVKRSFDTIS